jgi:hypothetical protein
MKKLSVFLILALFSSVSLAALLAPPKDSRNTSTELEVLPPMGFLGCEECENPYMGGVKGPSSADLELWRRYENGIFGGNSDQNTGADAIEED